MVINTPEEQVIGERAPRCGRDVFADLFSQTCAQGVSHNCLPKEWAEMFAAATVPPHDLFLGSALREPLKADLSEETRY